MQHIATPGFALAGDKDRIASALLQEAPLSHSPGVVRAVCALTVGEVIGLVQESGGASTSEDRRAAELYMLWLSVPRKDPAAAAVWYNLGVEHQRSGAFAAARDAFDNALRLAPDLHAAHLARALAEEAGGDRTTAIRTLSSLLPPSGAMERILQQRARMKEEAGDLPGAIEDLALALRLDGDQPDLVQHLVHDRQKLALWPVMATGVPGLSPDQVMKDCGPLAALALTDDVAHQRIAAANWIARKVPAAPMRLSRPGQLNRDRLRIGYMSSDLGLHALGFLMAGVFSSHDRTRFDIRGYALAPDDGSSQSRRIRTGCDAFRQLDQLSDAEAARLIRSDDVDILIDLNGLTRGARPGILRWKPAPVQLTYLGFVGPVPMEELDGFLCDAVTVPKGLDYGCAPIRLAGCYQANDDCSAASPPVTRAAEGLPEGAFVFAGASHHYKITQDVFQAWCEIVAAVPDSVLWLAADTIWSETSLRTAWMAAGLDPARLILAPRAAPDHYRARLALADLFLDTFPYNAGTVASDALRAGLPVLTRRGRAFASRMAASLLEAVDLGGLITSDEVAYKDLAIQLATDRQGALKAARAHLAAGAWGRTIGDTIHFTRRLERALESVWRETSGGAVRLGTDGIWCDESQAP